MAYTITVEDVWVGELEDRPGGLAGKLETLSRAGANLEFILCLRNMALPGSSTLFVSPVRADEEVQAAIKAGLTRWTTAHSLRIEGPDRPELGATIARAVANAEVNIRGASASTHGPSAAKSKVRVRDKCTSNGAGFSVRKARNASSASSSPTASACPATCSRFVVGP